MIKSFLRGCLRKSFGLSVFYIHSREDFPHILNARRLLGEGVEIGVQYGYFSEIILDSWRGHRLYSVDPWRAMPTDAYADIANKTQAEQDAIYESARRRLGRFGNRSRIHRMTSEEAAGQFEDGGLDFAYIDAQHHYEAVRRDLDHWAPKVREGGILAGHDFLDGEIAEGVFGVKSAVSEFAGGRRLLLSHERRWRSWFLFV